MDTKIAIATVSKALAGALVGGLVALMSRLGFNADQATQDALDYLITVLLGAAVGYVGVYFAPKNKEIK